MKKINITIFALILMSTASVAQLGKVDVSKQQGQATELLKKGDEVKQSSESVLDKAEAATDVLPEGVKEKGAELLEGAKKTATETAEGLVDKAEAGATEKVEGLVDGAKDKVSETANGVSENATASVNDATETVITPSASVADAKKNNEAKKEALGTSVLNAQEKISNSNALITKAKEQLDLDKAQGLISEADFLLKNENIEKAKIAVQGLQQKVTSAESSLK